MKGKKQGGKTPTKEGKQDGSDEKKNKKGKTHEREVVERPTRRPAPGKEKNREKKDNGEKR